MQEINFNNITIDKLSLPLFIEKKVEADVLRLDKMHSLISGNKWFKLRYYLEEAKSEKKSIATYGGAWSNHILATAAICKSNDIACTGIIRGEESKNLSATLLTAKELGMKLFFISREDYKNKKIPGKFSEDEYYFIPEGGYGIKGTEGAATILDHCEKERYTHICCASGTGTMTAGLLKSILSFQKIISISVLKNNAALENDIKYLTGNDIENLSLFHGYHFGGYAKHKQPLIDFMNNFYSHTNIPSDFVYTGKLFFGINDLVSNNYFHENSKLLLIHSGGLQGNTSLNNGTLIF